ncbi:MAG TPA: BMP family ABC transporter substrate-binding protein [Aggregatilineales bacterium]|nr:BMP family ABC transporter substrate-binding protein [Anaerolineales bacterium]HRE47326.1 BMP family ABC transporter substrate-binding protein [Aggregatilineales bacterium]
MTRHTHSKPIRTLAVILVTVCAVMLSACQPSAQPTAQPTVTPRSDYKLGLVTNEGGTINDGTFNELAHKGAALVSRDFGIDFAYRQSQEAKDYATFIEAMIAEGRNIIITVGYQMTEATLAAAEANPKVFFIGVDYTTDKDLKNFIGLQFREDQGGFLAGALAGMMTTSNVVGVVGGIQIPPVERFVNGFTNGAKYVNPAVKVLSVYTTSFADVKQGQDEADKMTKEGADVLFGAGGLTGSTAIVRAAASGAYVIGVDQDEYRTTFGGGKLSNADKILTSASKGVDTGVYAAVESILKGTMTPGTVLLSAANCGITYAPFHNTEAAVPAEVKTRLENIWRALAGGTLETGANDAAAKAPEPLAAGAQPEVKADAPAMSSCVKN